MRSWPVPFGGSVFQKNVRNPNHHYVSTKYRITPPICIAVHLQFVLQCFWWPYALGKGSYCHQCSSICIAVRLPFEPSICIAVLLGNLGGCGHRDAPQETPCTEVGTRSRAVLTQASRQVCLSLCPIQFWSIFGASLLEKRGSRHEVSWSVVVVTWIFPSLWKSLDCHWAVGAMEGVEWEKGKDYKGVVDWVFHPLRCCCSSLSR